MSNPEKLLKELIALPSVNPAFVPAKDPHAGEQRVADFLAARARRAGLEVEFQKVRPERANLLVRFSSSRQIRQRILLAPHLDTVGWTDGPGSLFSPRTRGGRLYGRGACDTKGSVAIMFSALVEMAVKGWGRTHTEILFAGLVDEECSQKGSRALIKRDLNVTLAIVGEPTRLKVVTAHKGALWLELKTRGKAAHGARPELGRNAVHLMAQVVDILQTTYADMLRGRTHALLGRATINVGAIKGGRQPNIVPPECVCWIDRRTLPGENDVSVLQEIRQILRRHGLLVEFKRLHPDQCAALETDPRDRMVQQFFAAVGQRGPVGADFFSDAGVLGGAGIPSVLFGPGDIAQAIHPMNGSS